MFEQHRIALYGRFVRRSRGAVAAAVAAVGGATARDLTRDSTMLAVGAGAVGSLRSGRLRPRLALARERGVPVHGEERFLALLDGEALERPGYPLSALPQTPAPGLLDVLDAFDLIHRAGEKIRFADVGVIRAAETLLNSAAGGQADPAALMAAPAAEGASGSMWDAALAQAAQALIQARAAPAGRRQIVPGPDGGALLAWEDGPWAAGLTTLEGQGLLPIDDAAPTLEDVFDQAMTAEAGGDDASAERLYWICARADRKDPVAPFNLGNILARRGAQAAAVMQYRLALARDPGFTEAYYNLAVSAEAAGDPETAEAALRAALERDAAYGDALFNLAQLRLEAGDRAEAKGLFTAYLDTDPPADWALKARKALMLIGADP